jgi:cysteinyl-tRNA synthetase
VSVYLCGPTVYGPPHLGHGRATIVYDVLRRYLEWTGLRVRIVSNITDIDDNIINKAQRDGRPGRRSRAVRAALVRLDGRARRRTADGRAARDGVRRRDGRDDRQLVERDAAYLTDDGVYLDVSAVPDYGLLPHQDIEEMIAGGGERTSTDRRGKRHRADFVLWKLSKPTSRRGRHRGATGGPGWHSECVVMSLDLLGEGFDLHCGGQDLKFPHHENERAQAVALGRNFANHWMHHGWVVDTAGEKMSKSLGNVDNVVDLLEHVRPARLPDAAASRRTTAARRPSAPDNLEAASKTLAGPRLVRARTGAAEMADADESVLRSSASAWTTISTRPRRPRCCFETVRRANVAWDAGDPRPLHSSAPSTRCAPRIGLVLATAGDVPAEALAKADALDAARAAKDFAAADALRAELQADGWTVETTKSGTTSAIGAPPRPDLWHVALAAWRRRVSEVGRTGQSRASGGAGLAVADVDESVLEQERRLLLAHVGSARGSSCGSCPSIGGRFSNGIGAAPGVPDDQPDPSLG